MLSQEQISFYKENGYLKGGKLLTDAEVDHLREELERVIRDQKVPGIPQPATCRNISKKEEHPVWQIVNIHWASAGFKKLLDMATLKEQILDLSGGEKMRLWHDQIQYKPAATGGVNMWHQDAPYWPVLGKALGSFTAWIALDEVDEDNGCMSMVPGSHLWGKATEVLAPLQDFRALPSEFNGNVVKVVPCPVGKGEVHFHHSMTWHGSHENRSGRPRRAIALHFMEEKNPFDQKQNHLLKPYIDVKDQEPIQGKLFPIVAEKTPAATH